MRNTTNIIVDKKYKVTYRLYSRPNSRASRRLDADVAHIRLLQSFCSAAVTTPLARSVVCAVRVKINYHNYNYALYHTYIF